MSGGGFSFNFGGNAGSTSNNSGSPFGGANNSANKTGGSTSLFGGSNTNTSSTLGATTSNPSPFGAASGQKPTTLFGASSTPSSSNLFGAGSTSAQSKPPSFNFGPTTTSGSDSTKSPFGAASSATGTANAAPSTSSTKPSNIFGNAQSTGGSSSNLFGGGASSTPASSKFSFANSTTPAGPPPGTSLFGQPKPTGPGAEQNPQSTKSDPKPTSASAGTLFSAPSNTKPSNQAFGFNLNSTQGTTSEADKNAQKSPGLFGEVGQSQAANKQGPQPTQPTPNKGLFGTGTTTATPPSQPAKNTFAFNQTSAATQSSSTPATTSADTSAAGSAGSLFAGTNTSTATSSSLFGNANNKSSAPGSTPLFGNFNNKSSAAVPASTTATAGTTTAASSGPSTTTAAAPSNLFSNANKTAQTTSSQTPATTTMASGATGSGNLASSTAGPAPSSQSRLKNKSMDEIITRWAADLSKYQKEFQDQAQQVAAWDRALVENTDKVNALFGKTFQAERDAAEVERQLRIVEEQQDELGSFLDRYEKEVDSLIQNNGIKGPDGLRGPDQERERTYKLAEKLQDRLNELNKDLTEMIQEINSVSQTLSKTGKADDPLTKVVRVLNSHLAQLQVIDTGANQLQEKLKAAQKEGQRFAANGWQGLGSDPTEDFYRSFRGNRTERFGGMS